MKITKAWIKKWKPCDEAIEWIEEQDTKDVFELIRKLRHSNVSNKYDWLFWAIPRLIKTKKDKIRFALYCIEFVTLPIVEEECLYGKCHQEATRDVKDAAIRYAVWSIVEMTEAIHWATTKKNKIRTTKAVTKVVAIATKAVTKAGKYVDEKRDAIVDYGVKLLKEQSN